MPVFINHLDENPADGRYYVSAVDGDRYWLLLGPFTRHRDALDRVERVRDFAVKGEPRAHFYGFGTCGAHDERSKMGSGNAVLLSEDERGLLVGGAA